MHLDYRTLEDLVGREIGCSQWTHVSQDEANLFAEVTRDPDPMHTDPQWASGNSPYGRTVVAGMQMIALLPFLTRWSALEIEGVALAMNYGFNRIRFIAPLPIGARFRNRITLVKADRRGHKNMVIVTRNEFELETRAEPVVSAEWVNLLWPCAAAAEPGQANA